MDHSIQLVVQQVAWLLLGAALVGMLAHWIRVPYAVALVLAGLAVNATHLLVVPPLEPPVLLFVLLPPLLFDAAFRLDEREARTVFPSILMLAVPGVLITAALVGLAVALPLHLAPATGLLFGSIVAATDPVAVTAVLRQLRVHNRLGTIVEAESLVNDGMAITLYTATLSLVTGGALGPLHAVLLFGQQVFGGALVGLALGLLFSKLTSAIDDHLVEMTLSTALAYGSYLAAEALGTSGALACVVAGFIHGSYGRRTGMSQNTRDLLDSLWEYVGFFANGVLFLLVGLNVDLDSFGADRWAVLVAIGAILVARVLVVELATRLVPRERTLAGARARVVLVWSGLRGALTMVLAISLPAAVSGRSVVIAMALGVVLFTLVGQGLTLPLVLRLTGFRRAT